MPVARVIHHGIDASTFPVGQGDGGYLLFLGKMTPEKGAHRALEAAFKAGQRLILAGKVREPAERWYFERYVAPYLNDRLRFVGEVSQEEKRDLLAGARALLFPIRWNEPFGIVMLEALACGTPVLAFDEGAAGEVVEDGRTGLPVHRRGPHGRGHRAGRRARPGRLPGGGGGPLLGRADGGRVPRAVLPADLRAAVGAAAAGVRGRRLVGRRVVADAADAGSSARE